MEQKRRILPSAIHSTEVQGRDDALCLCDRETGISVELTAAELLHYVCGVSVYVFEPWCSTADRQR